ncbi:putative holliday junction resolvase [Bacillus phage vB_BceS-M2]|nr:putative holliday junction resolvase [Bacillus phage PBC5]
MMFGELRGYKHSRNEPIKKRVIVGYDVYKKGAKKAGQKKPIYGWVDATKKRKVQIGTRIPTRGKFKGQEVPVFETRDMIEMSTGYYPSENAIYFINGGTKRLSPMAYQKMIEWKAEAMKWQEETGWITQEGNTKVIAEMWFYFPDDKTRDTHNAKKLLMDSLEGVIHNNDMYIIDRTIDFTTNDPTPRIEINFYVKE